MTKGEARNIRCAIIPSAYRLPPLLLYVSVGVMGTQWGFMLMQLLITKEKGRIERYYPNAFLQTVYYLQEVHHCFGLALRAIRYTQHRASLIFATGEGGTTSSF